MEDAGLMVVEVAKCITVGVKARFSWPAYVVSAGRAS